MVFGYYCFKVILGAYISHFIGCKTLTIFIITESYRLYTNLIKYM